MPPFERAKRLAEVDFPIAGVSKHAAREKSIRPEHPSILHLWWARPPLASSRAVLIALVLPDPCDPICPESFKQKRGDPPHVSPTPAKYHESCSSRTSHPSHPTLVITQ